jgi:formylglycine-generating enzyme required for sulfatase activity
MLPATGVSREEAAEYCRWVQGRLPTLSEWEVEALTVPVLPASFSPCEAPRPVESSEEPPSSRGFRDLVSNTFEFLSSRERNDMQQVSVGGFPCGWDADDIRTQVSRRNWRWERSDWQSPFHGFRCIREIE